MTLREKCGTVHCFIQEIMQGTDFTQDEYKNVLDIIEDIREFFFDLENNQ